MRGGGLRGLTVALVAPLAACLQSPPETGLPTCDSGTGIAEISLGRDHACARLDNGGVWCWGLNDQGQLGDGTAIDRSLPTQVVGLDEVAHLAVGQDHSCALKIDGTLWCWGSGSNGQLGNGETEDSFEPLQADITGVADVSLGDDFTCAATTEGAVYCWGENEHGQAGSDFGDGVQEESPTPIELDRPALHVVAGKNHGCALLDGNQVACWGGADLGQLGDGTLAQRGYGATVGGIDGVLQLAAGRDHTCAITGDQALWCWGSNERGQLGLPGDNDADDCTSGDGLPMSCVPVAVDLGGPVLAVTAGLHHTCAVVAGGTVRCFGGNEAGQLGNGDYQDSSEPVMVAIEKPIATLAAGETQTCAVSADDSVYCWGSNRAAQLAETGALIASTPVAVPGTDGVTAIAAGSSHTCALVAGALECWGANDDAQLGDQTLQSRSKPTEVTAASSGAAMITAGEANTCILNGTGNVRCWGRSGHGESGPNGSGDYVLDAVLVPIGPDVVQTDVGDEHGCAVVTDNTLYCWGSDDEGQLGDGDGGGDGLVMVGLAGVAQIACGDEHTCARQLDGMVNCWGTNLSGQLGDNSTTSRDAPAPEGLSLVSAQIDVGDAFSCSLDETGAVSCWGANQFGQIGDGSNEDRLAPAPVGNLTNVTAIALGTEHACAIVSDPDSGRLTVRCWGRNDGGQLGDGTTESSPLPVSVDLPGDARAIAAGARHTCAIVAVSGTNRVYCWGSDIDGTLGSGRELYRATAFGPITVCSP